MSQVLNNLISPLLTRHLGVTYANWFGVMLCAASVLFVFISLPIDINSDQKIYLQSLKIENVDVEMTKFSSTSSDLSLKENKNNDLIDSNSNNNPLHKEVNEENNDNKNINIKKKGNRRGSVIEMIQEKAEIIQAKELKTTEIIEVKLTDALSFSRLFWILCALVLSVYGIIIPFNNIASTLLLERNYFQTTPSDCTLSNIYECQSNTNKPISSCPKIGYQPPLPMNITIPGYGYFAQLTEKDIDCNNEDWKGEGTCTYDYCAAFANAQEDAAEVHSIPYIMSFFLSPIFGYTVDKYGNLANFCALSILMLTWVHFILGYTAGAPEFALICQGIGYAGFSSVVWPAIPLSVPEHHVGIAFGVVNSVQNLGFFVIPLIVAEIFNLSDNSYIPNVELFFGLLSIVCLLLSLYLIYIDKKLFESKLNLFIATDPEKK
jgi:hypothetical protein